MGMDNFELLQNLEKDIAKCMLCGGCQAVCPVYGLSRYEYDSARGKILLAKALMDGEIKPDRSLAEKFDHCLTCMSCVTACPVGANPVEIINAARGEIHKRAGGDSFTEYFFSKVLQDKRKFSIFAACAGLAANAARYLPAFALPFTRDGIKRKLPDFSIKSLKSGYPEIIVPKKNRKAEKIRVAYFTGCMTDRIFLDTGRAVIEIFKSAGVEIVLSKVEVCCGAPAFFAGDRKNAAKLAEKNIKTFLEKGVDYIVTSCATCGSVLKEIYPRLLEGNHQAEKFSAKVVDFHEFLEEELLNRLEFIKPEGDPLKVTWHDPCHLSRSMGVTRAPREILKKLPGVEYVEMEGAGNCCGGAGAFSLKYYDDAIKIGQDKATAVKASGADVVATACPSCSLQIADALNRADSNAKVTHTAQLVRKLLKPSED